MQTPWPSLPGKTRSWSLRRMGIFIWLRFPRSWIWKWRKRYRRLRFQRIMVVAEPIKRLTVSEYLLVSQKEPRIEQFLRQENGQWLLREAAGLDAALALPSLNVTISLDE